METYKASLDTTGWVITIFVFLILLMGLIMTFVAKPFYAGLITMAVPLLIIIIAYPYRVNYYVITNDSLIIKRALTSLNRVIPFSDIESISIPPKEDFKGSIRTMGNGGLFGYYGWYYNKKLGNFRMYATNSNRILIVLKNSTHEKIVISPDDTGMADVLEKRLKK